VPGVLRLFSAWLIVMLPVVIGSQAVYLLLVDHWSFGLKNVHVVSALTSLGVVVLLLQARRRSCCRFLGAVKRLQVECQPSVPGNVQGIYYFDRK
jgi:hypothetical protein